jgi:putative RNA 2'-phosphotransferase
MDATRLTKISKYLSKHLRHQPERLGLSLQPGGWVEVKDLLAACVKNRFPISQEELEQVVEESDKQRFSFDETGEKIRANQGHSTEVDLQLTPVEPPEFLYHGTGDRSVEAILKTGLIKMSRHHVHLSKDTETARRVGMRHGKPAIFIVKAKEMHAAGHIFYCSANGVWLSENVPIEYLEVSGEK